MDGIVDEEAVEVVLIHEVLDVLLEDVNEVDEVDGGVVAGAKALVVVLEGNDGSEHEGLGVLGVEEVVVEGEVATGLS